MPAKMRRAAVKSALAAKVNDLVIVDSFAALKETKTKAAWKVLHDLKVSDKKLLVVVDKQTDGHFALSVRNLKNVTVVQANNIGVKELLDCEAVLTSQAMIEAITKWLMPSTDDEKKQTAKKPKSKKATTEKAHSPTVEKEKADKKASSEKASTHTHETKKAETHTQHAHEAKKAEPVEHKVSKKEGSDKEKESPLRSIANTSAKTDKSDTHHSTKSSSSKSSSSSKLESKPKESGGHSRSDKGKGKSK